jgi:hypothetical protein
MVGIYDVDSRVFTRMLLDKNLTVELHRSFLYIFFSGENARF